LVLRVKIVNVEDLSERKIVVYTNGDWDFWSANYTKNIFDAEFEVHNDHFVLKSCGFSTVLDPSKPPTSAAPNPLRGDFFRTQNFGALPHRLTHFQDDINHVSVTPVSLDTLKSPYDIFCLFLPFCRSLRPHQ